MTGPSEASPSAPGHAEARLALGALVLGALEPLERAAVEAHVASCAQCSAELVDLAVLPGLLGRLTPEQAADVGRGRPEPAEPPAELLERILSRGAQEAGTHTAVETDRPGEDDERPRRGLDHTTADRPEHPSRMRRRRRITAVVAAAIGSVAGIGWLIAGPLTPDGNSAGVVVIQGRDQVSNVNAELTMSPTPNGTQLSLALAGVQPGEDCQLVAWTDDGRKEVASSWRASYQGQADVTGSTSLSLSDIAGVTIKTPDGRKLLVLNVPS
ncbi:MAG: anti-sigma factor family protein [Cellulomonas sp.]